MLLKLRPDCDPLIRQQQQQQQLTKSNNNNKLLNHPCYPAIPDTSTVAAVSELSLESRLADEFYSDVDTVGEGPSRSQHHPHEDFDTFYEDDQANVRHSGDYDYHHTDYYHHSKPLKKKKHFKKFHRAPFYAEIAGFNPPQGVILNPKDTIFTPGIEPGGLAAITPSFMKFLRGHVKNIGKTKKKKKKRLDP